MEDAALANALTDVKVSNPDKKQTTEWPVVDMYFTGSYLVVRLAIEALGFDEDDIEEYLEEA